MTSVPENSMSATLTLPIATPPPLVGPLLSAALTRLRRFTREEYRKLGELGLIGPEEKVELLDGFVVEKPMKGPQGVTRRLISRLAPLLPDGWFLQIQDVVGLPHSEPEPDGAVIRGDVAIFDTRQPEPADVGIVIEVADSTLRADRREKARLYAQAAIPVYWIINIADGAIEIYTDPESSNDLPRYAARTDFRSGQSIPILLDGVAVTHIAAADLLP